jgi:hypothetical protein
MRQQVIEDRFQKVNWNAHVEGDNGSAVCRVLELERADPDEVTSGSNHGCTAPMRMGRRREDSLIEKVLPITGKLLTGHDPSRQ